jgi:hypothetical protein
MLLKLSEEQSKNLLWLSNLNASLKEELEISRKSLEDSKLSLAEAKSLLITSESKLLSLSEINRKQRESLAQLESLSEELRKSTRSDKIKTALIFGSSGVVLGAIIGLIVGVTM